MALRSWLAADFVADVAYGLLVGLWAWLAADFEADVADGLLVGQFQRVHFQMTFARGLLR